MLLLGAGIGYSASPRMHAAAFAAAGLDWSYELADVPADALPKVVESLRGEDVAGANVTIPYKTAVMALLDAVDAVAANIGAVNTVLKTDSRLIGSNTDVVGVRAALQQLGMAEPAGARVLVLGAGGSARAVAAAMPGADLTFVAREGRQRELPGKVLPWERQEWRDAARGCDLLVNATPLGRRGEIAVADEDLPRDAAVLDLVYARGGTPLVAAARDRGNRCADGWTVLLAQGAASFEAWTGRTAPVEAMRQALGA